MVVVEEESMVAVAWGVEFDGGLEVLEVLFMRSTGQRILEGGGAGRRGVFGSGREGELKRRWRWWWCWWREVLCIYWL